MNRQRRIDWLFGALLGVVGAVRYARRNAPVLVCFLVAIGSLVLNHMPRVAGEAQAHAADVMSADSAQASLLTGTGAAGTARAHHAPAPALSAEQQNLARFIAGTYRLAVEQTQWFVEHAYRVARELKLDPMLILAVISVESNFDPKAQSPQGAQGLMQVITRIHAEKFQPYGGVSAAFDPLSNIRVGALILREFIKRAGSVEGALKAYVGAAAMPHDSGYGAKVILERERMAAVAAGLPPPSLASLRAAWGVGSGDASAAGGRVWEEAGRTSLASEAEAVPGDVPPGEHTTEHR